MRGVTVGSTTKPEVIHLPYINALNFEPPANSVLVAIANSGEKSDVDSAPYVDSIYLDFDDVEVNNFVPAYGALTAISPVQAIKLADFLKKHRGKNIIAHCMAGISRSGAVAQAVLDCWPEYKDAGFPKLRHPNNRVLTWLKRELGCVPMGA